MFLWDRLSVGSKSAFKEAVLGAMIDKEKFVRRAAANVIQPDSDSRRSLLHRNTAEGVGRDRGAHLRQHE